VTGGGGGGGGGVGRGVYGGGLGLARGVDGVDHFFNTCTFASLVFSLKCPLMRNFAAAHSNTVYASAINVTRNVTRNVRP
jgi:hypothetical protein